MISNEQYKLNLYALPALTSSPAKTEDISKSSFDITMSEYCAQPLLSTGFNYYILQSYDNFNNELSKQGNKTFFWVVNAFEIILTNQERKNELIDSLKLYFKAKNDNFIVSSDTPSARYFLHIWEMLVIFDLINQNNKINIVSSEEDAIKKSLELFKDNLSSDKTAIEYKNSNVDLSIITFDDYKTVKEQESFNFIDLFSELVKGLSILNNNGKLIIKLNDIFTLPTLKIILLCQSIFEEVYIYKPYYSRASDSIKYLVCINKNEKAYNNINKKLDKCLTLIKSNNKLFVTDLMSDINVPKQLLHAITYINIYISGEQHKTKNQILKYIKSDNYFGQEYQDYLDRQITSTEYFLSNFCPVNKNDYIEIKKKFTNKIKKTNNELEDFIKQRS